MGNSLAGIVAEASNTIIVIYSRNQNIGVAAENGEFVGRNSRGGRQYYNSDILTKSEHRRGGGPKE